MTKQRALAAIYAVTIVIYLSFVLYFLTIRPGGASGSFEIMWVITAFASGIMMTMAVYTVALYMFRQGDKAALYFALNCIGTGIRFFALENSRTITALIPDCCTQN